MSLRHLAILGTIAGSLALCALSVSSALAAQRIALVIGNSAYRHVPLKNPVNDARGMTEALKDAGFQVTELLDANQRQIQRAILKFGQSLKRDDVGLFYYSGHGVQVGGRNYMIPLGAEIEVEEHVEVEGVDLVRVLARMAGARNRMNIVIVDACRNNPFKQTFRYVTRGLAETPAPPDTYIAYAAAPGQVASDGFGANSIYTGALMKAIRQPGKAIEAVFKQVRATVLNKTSGQQVSWTSSSITDEFFFTEGRATATAQLPAQVTGDLVVALYQEFQFWEEVRGSDNPEDLEAYLAQFPNGNFVKLARNRLKLLEGRQSRTQAAETGTAGAQRLSAERQAAKLARLAAERQAAKASRLEAERQAEAEQAKIEAERKAAKAARIEAERQKARAARLVAERKAAEAVRVEAESKAAAETARLEAERKAVEAARQEAERIATAEGARLEAERQALEATRMETEQRLAQALRLEAQRILAETARVEAERKAEAELAKLDAELKAAEAARQEIDRLAAVLARLEAERKAAEAARQEAERKIAESVNQEAERLAAEAARLEAERKIAKAANLEAESKLAAEAARLDAARKSAQATRGEIEHLAALGDAQEEAELRAREATKLAAERELLETLNRQAASDLRAQMARLEARRLKISQSRQPSESKGAVDRPVAGADRNVDLEKDRVEPASAADKETVTEVERQIAAADAARWHSTVQNRVVTRKAEEAAKLEAQRQTVQAASLDVERQAAKSMKRRVQDQMVRAAQREMDESLAAQRTRMEMQWQSVSTAASRWYGDVQGRVGERKLAEAARREAERKAAEVARREAERKAAEVARREAERKAAEAARREVERKAAEASRASRRDSDPTADQQAAKTSRIESPKKDKAQRKTLTTASIMGDWCGEEVNITLSSSSWKFRLKSGDEVTFSIKDYRLFEDRIWVYWQDNANHLLVTEFGEFNDTRGTMDQMRGRTEPSGNWKSYNRRFARC